MKTDIRSNGSKWGYEKPDSIETLIEVMGKYALDPMFEKYGDFGYRLDAENCGQCKEDIGKWHFFGNFSELSHVFDIITDDPDIIDRLRAAISTNKNTEAYRRWAE